MTRAAADQAGRCLHQVREELTGRGFAVAWQLRHSDSPRDVCTEVMLVSPAALARGDARISDTGTALRKCRFATAGSPAGGLTPAQTAGALEHCQVSGRGPDGRSAGTQER